MIHDERSRCIICDAPIETHFVVPIDAPQGALCSANCVNRWFQRSTPSPLARRFPPMTRLEFRNDQEKLAFLDSVANEYATHPKIVALASRLIRRLRPDAYLAQAREIHRFVRDGIRYQPDPNRQEQLINPVSVIERGRDDCDGKAVTAVALMRAVGLDARVHPRWAGDELEHVQVRVRFPGSDHVGGPYREGAWLIGEVTIRGAELGEDPHQLPKNPETGKLPLA